MGQVEGTTVDSKNVISTDIKKAVLAIADDLVLFVEGSLSILIHFEA